MNTPLKPPPSERGDGPGWPVIEFGTRPRRAKVQVQGALRAQNSGTSMPLSLLRWGYWFATAIFRALQKRTFSAVTGI